MSSPNPEFDETTTYPLIEDLGPILQAMRKKARAYISEVQQNLDSTFSEYLKLAEGYLLELRKAAADKNDDAVSQKIAEIEKLLPLMKQVIGQIKDKLAEAEKHINSQKTLHSKNDEFISAEQALIYTRIFTIIYKVIEKIYNPNKYVDNGHLDLYDLQRPLKNSITVVAHVILESLSGVFSSTPLTEPVFLELVFQFASNLGNSEATVKLGKLYEQSENYKGALECYLKAAKAGNSEAMYCAGCLYFKGLGVEADQKLAAEFFERAIEDPNNIYEAALIAYGDCCFYGFGRGADQKLAFELYSQAEQLGAHKARIMLGRCYKAGAGVAQDTKKAMEYFNMAGNYLKARDQANVELGHCYLEGIGVSPSRELAAYHFYSAFHLRYSALSKDVNLPVFTDPNLTLMELSSLDRYSQDSLEHLQKAGDLGNITSILDLSSYYDNSYRNGVYRQDERHRDSDYALEVMQIFLARCAPQQRNIYLSNKYKNKPEDMSDAYFRMLGILQRIKTDGPSILRIMLTYFDSVSALMPEDFPEGGNLNFENVIAYLEKLAKDGDPAALSALGFAYQYGLGVEPNFEKAIDYYLRAFEKNNFYCLKHLWNFYRQVPRMESLGKLLVEGCLQWIQFEKARYSMSQVDHHSLVDSLTLKTALSQTQKSSQASRDAQLCTLRILRNRLKDAHALLGRIFETPGDHHNVWGALEHFEDALQLEPGNFGLQNRCKIFTPLRNIRSAVVETTSLPTSICSLIAEFAHQHTRKEDPRLNETFWYSQDEKYIREMMRIDSTIVSKQSTKRVAITGGSQNKTLMFSAVAQGQAQAQAQAQGQGQGQAQVQAQAPQFEIENQRRVSCMKVINGILKMANDLFNSPGPFLTAMQNEDFYKYFVLRLNIIRMAHARAVSANQALKLLAEKQGHSVTETKQRNDVKERNDVKQRNETEQKGEDEKRNADIMTQRNADIKTLMEILQNSWHLVQVIFDPIQELYIKASAYFDKYSNCWTPEQEKINIIKLPDHLNYVQMVEVPKVSVFDK